MSCAPATRPGGADPAARRRQGRVAAALAHRWGEGAALAAGLGVILGHMFPVWLGFRGGKGVATALGVLIALAWPVALVAALIWLAVASSPAIPRSPR